MTVASTVWLASYPKSGNTWFRGVLAAVRTGDPFDLVGSGLNAANRASFDTALGVSSTDLTCDEAAALRPLADEQLARTRGADTTLVRKIHDGLRTGPDGELIVSAAVTRGAVYLVRDPRDVAVSYAHHNARDVSWAVERMCSPQTQLAPVGQDASVQLRQRLGTWSQHVQSWLSAPFPVLAVRYEDCLAEPVATFGAALDFAGLDVSRADLTAAVEASAFERLREREAASGFAEIHNRRSPFFRRGRAGGWREELPADLARRLEDEHGEVMARVGYLDTAASSTPAASSTSPTAASRTSSDAGA